MTTAVLTRNRGSWDSDAGAYISAVELADGQSLEIGIKRAINQFVINCKTRGIWNSIKSCCLLCGARTLSGALVPLKGSAPTNNNFTNSDYNRETGLKGNGSNKSLLSNRLENSDPQNNKHLSVYIGDRPSSTIANGIIGTGTSTGSSLIGSNLNGFNYSLNSSSTTTIGQTYPAGFIGLSRNNSNTLSIRFNQTSNTTNNSSISTNSNNIGILGFMSGLSASSSRVAFYSIGESLDLSSLEFAVQLYLNNISSILTSNYTILDSTANSYISAVQSIDNQILTYAYRKGVDEFISGCKNDNIWNSIKSSCILIGAKTLRGALYPLVGTAPISIGFTEGNYNRNLGLYNLYRSGWLDSNRNNNIDPQDDQHLAVYVSIAESTSTEYQYIGAGSNDAGTSSISSNANRRCRNGVAASAPIITSNTLAGMSRNNSSSFIDRTNGINTTFAVASQTPFSANIGVFSRHTGVGVTNAALSYYSIGTSLDLALLDNRVTTLVKELSSARSL